MTYDLVVIGGGIVGAATCYYANKLGARCALIERDQIASHASGFAFGGLHPRVVASKESSMPDFSKQSYTEHQKLHESLEADHEVVSTWRERNALTLVTDPKEAEYFGGLSNNATTAESWLDHQALRELEPSLNNELAGALVGGESAEVNAHDLTAGLVRISNATVVLDEVVSVETASAQVKSVSTRLGQKINSSAFVFAMGPWSTRAFDWFDLPVSVQPLKGQILRLRTKGWKLKHSVSIDGNYLAIKPDGLLWIGTTEEQVGFNETTTLQARDEILSVLRKVIDPYLDVDVVKQTACLRPMSADGEIILGQIPAIDNAFIGTGGGRKGILYGPLMGKVLAEQALSIKEQNTWESLSPGRFLLPLCTR